MKTSLGHLGANPLGLAFLHNIIHIAPLVTHFLFPLFRTCTLHSRSRTLDNREKYYFIDESETRVDTIAIAIDTAESVRSDLRSLAIQTALLLSYRPTTHIAPE